MLEALKKEVCEANISLVKYGLVILTWGNVSGIDRESGCFVIKPSGVPYDKMTPDMMVVVDNRGRKVEGDLNPSSDTPTHAVLYGAFPNIGGITHTHSTFATAIAQTGRGIPAYGTTHADNFYGDIPCARALKKVEITGEYERETGNVIAETFAEHKINPDNMPAVLVRNHGPFTWGKNAAESAENAAALEEIAKMAVYGQAMSTVLLSGSMLKPISKTLLDKHFFRKHGANVYYGQNNK